MSVRPKTEGLPLKALDLLTEVAAEKNAPPPDPPLPPVHPVQDEDGVVRASFLPAPHAFHLEHACAMIHQAFGDCPYLVGSCLMKRDYRDVDVRLILSDEQFAHHFPACGDHPERHALWSLMCSTISDWLSKRTGLPIDFQIQQRTAANKMYPRRPRRPMGLFFAARYPGGE